MIHNYNVPLGAVLGERFSAKQTAHALIMNYEL